MAKLPPIPAVTTEQLAFAYSVGGAAATGLIPQSGVGGMGLNLDLGDGESQRIELTDIPSNRAMIAIRDQFPPGMLQPLMMRIWAMGEMLSLPEAEPYIRPDPDTPAESQISEAFFVVAAAMPLNAKAKFNRRTFFKRVATEFAASPD
jgi:hypothetical protein